MKLRRFLLRYFPPGKFSQIAKKNSIISELSGISLEYEQNGQTKTKSIDLVDLRPE